MQWRRAHPRRIRAVGVVALALNAIVLLFEPWIIPFFPPGCTGPEQRILNLTRQHQAEMEEAFYRYVEAEEIFRVVDVVELQVCAYSPLFATTWMDYKQIYGGRGKYTEFSEWILWIKRGERWTVGIKMSYAFLFSNISFQVIPHEPRAQDYPAGENAPSRKFPIFASTGTLSTRRLHSSRTKHPP